MGSADFDSLRITNKKLLEARPVLEGEPYEEIRLRFIYVGDVVVRPVYIDYNRRVMRRIGDKIYFAFPMDTPKAVIKERLNDVLVISSIRRYAGKVFNHAPYPRQDVSSSFGQGYMILEGTRYTMRAERVISKGMHFLDGEYIIGYRYRISEAKPLWNRWRRGIIEQRAKDSFERILPNLKYKAKSFDYITVKGGKFYNSHDKDGRLTIHFPLGCCALTDDEMDIVFTYLLIKGFEGWGVEELDEQYPCLFELSTYCLRKYGLRATRELVCSKTGTLFTDDYFARKGEKVKEHWECIIRGRGAIWAVALNASHAKIIL